MSYDAEKLEQAAQKMGQHSGRTEYISCVDVTNWVQFQDAAAHCDHEFGPVDIVVNSHGAARVGATMDVGKTAQSVSAGLVGLPTSRLACERATSRKGSSSDFDNAKHKRKPCRDGLKERRRS